MDVKKSIKLRIGVGFEWMEVGTERTIKLDDLSSEEQVEMASAHLFSLIKTEAVADACKVFNTLNIPCEKGILLNAYKRLEQTGSGETAQVNIIPESVHVAAAKIEEQTKTNAALSSVSAEEQRQIVEEVEELFQFTEFK